MYPEEIEEFNKNNKRLYIIYGVALIVGILLLCFGWNKNGLLGYVTILPGLLLTVGGFIFLINAFSSNYTIKKITKAVELGEEYKETYIDWPNWTKKYGRIVVFVFILFPFIIGSRLHENNFGGNKLVWHSILFGFIFGFCAFYFLRSKITSWKSRKEKSNEICFYIVVISIIWSLSFAPIINRNLQLITAPICKEYPLIHKGENAYHGTKYLHVLVNGKSERFCPPHNIFKELSEKDSTIILCVQKGFLGYDFVKKFMVNH